MTMNFPMRGSVSGREVVRYGDGDDEGLILFDIWLPGHRGGRKKLAAQNLIVVEGAALGVLWSVGLNHLAPETSRLYLAEPDVGR